MPLNTRYVPGDYNVQCDRTGRKYKASECRHEWTGNLVRKQSWEPRQPQDLLRSIKDDQSVPDPNPWPEEDTFLATNEVTVDDL